MMQKALVIDYTLCTGCRTCEMACSLDHTEECNPRLSRIRIVKDEFKGENFPISCALCTSPPCLSVCPVGAIKIKIETGVAVINEDRCIGCKECIVWCPFAIININPKTGKVFKCDLCDGDPVCVKYCPSEAIKFIPIDQAMGSKRRTIMEETLAATEKEMITTVI